MYWVVMGLNKFYKLTMLTLIDVAYNIKLSYCKIQKSNFIVTVCVWNCLEVNKKALDQMLVSQLTS